MKRKDLVTAIENMEDLDRLKNIQSRLSSLGIYSEIQKEKNGKFKRYVLKVKACDLDTASEVFKVFGFESLPLKHKSKPDDDEDALLKPSLGSRDIPDYEPSSSTTIEDILSLADKLGADIDEERLDLEAKKGKSAGEQEFLASNVNLLPVFHQKDSGDELRSIQSHLNTQGIFSMIIKEQTKSGVIHSLVVAPKDMVVAVEEGEIFRQTKALENAKLHDGLAVSPDAKKVIDKANENAPEIEEASPKKDDNAVIPTLSDNLFNVSDEMHASLIANMDKTKAEMDKKKEEQQKDKLTEQEEQMVLKNDDED